MAAVTAQDTADEIVCGGVDSHADTVHVAVISDNGGHLADAEFATTAAGYAAAVAFLTAHGHVIAIGVEGTASYGAGFTRAARSAGLHVVEVNRPDRAERRRIGKSDPIDAYAAARAALSGRACPDGPPVRPRTTPSPGYVPCTTPPAPPSRPAPPP
ncbi:transposase [Streptomyces sp. TRM68367]|uniref:IS110 family transposase n=1 Tax=Streptomyces sp. TRM68367 TaxID=2758415 RepID=UPI0021CF3EB0|nr:transposase [Streptomyces sp. TRM68367]